MRSQEVSNESISATSAANTMGLINISSNNNTNSSNNNNNNRSSSYYSNTNNINSHNKIRKAIGTIQGSSSSDSSFIESSAFEPYILQEGRYCRLARCTL